jgi:hypothetical protein
MMRFLLPAALAVALLTGMSAASGFEINGYRSGMSLAEVQRLTGPLTRLPNSMAHVMTTPPGLPALPVDAGPPRQPFTCGDVINILAAVWHNDRGASDRVKYLAGWETTYLSDHYPHLPVGGYLIAIAGVRDTCGSSFDYVNVKVSTILDRYARHIEAQAPPGWPRD